MEYEFPPHVKASAQCRDLLNRILEPDPAKRITISGIQCHPWYTTDLPPGVGDMNDNLPYPGPDAQVRGIKGVLDGRITYLLMPGSLQPVVEIEHIIHEAQKPLQGGNDWDTGQAFSDGLTSSVDKVHDGHLLQHGMPKLSCLRMQMNSWTARWSRMQTREIMTGMEAQYEEQAMRWAYKPSVNNL